VAAAEHYSIERRSRSSTIEAHTSVLEKCRVDENRKRDALAAATGRVRTAERQLQNEVAALEELRRRFEQTMRQTASTDLHRGFRDHVEGLIEKAVPETSYVTFRTALGERRDVPVTGDATARRRALFKLRQEILNNWPLEPLDDVAFKERFRAAVAALPAVEDPPTAEQFIARQNGSAA